MAWRDELRDGMFRGAPFYCEEAKLRGGRRQAVFEYPQREQGDSEDMGRKLRRFSLDLFVLGEEYMAARDQLLVALESAGPAWLVHPYLGELYVAVEDFDLTESTKEGGIAKFSVQFVEKPTDALDDLLFEQPSQVAAAIAAVQVQAPVAFAESFGVQGQSSFVQTAAASRIDAMLDAVSGIAGPVGAFNVALRKLANSVTNLLLQPGNLALSLIQLQQSLTASLNLPRTALNAQLQLLRSARASTGGTLAPALTPSHQVERDNAAALQGLTVTAALLEIASLVASEKATALFQSPDDQDALYAEWVSALDERMAAAAGALLTSLQAVQAAFVQEWKRQARLVIGHYRVTTTAPAVVLAYRATGDAKDEGELVARNRVRHPLFVAAGSALELPRNG